MLADKPMSIPALICYLYELSEILHVPFQQFVANNNLANKLYQKNEVAVSSVSAT